MEEVYNVLIRPKDHSHFICISFTISSRGTTSTRVTDRRLHEAMTNLARIRKLLPHVVEVSVVVSGEVQTAAKETPAANLILIQKYFHGFVYRQIDSRTYWLHPITDGSTRCLACWLSDSVGRTDPDNRIGEPEICRSLVKGRFNSSIEVAFEARRVCQEAAPECHSVVGSDTQAASCGRHESRSSNLPWRARGKLIMRHWSPEGHCSNRTP